MLPINDEDVLTPTEHNDSRSGLSTTSGLLTILFSVLLHGVPYTDVTFVMYNGT